MAITVPSTLTIPTAITYRTATGRTTPLSNAEVDQNFAFLHDFSDKRLLITDFTADNMIAKLNADSSTAAPGGLNVSTLRGAAPSTSHVTNTSTVVLRSTSGDFSARNITANLIADNNGNFGKADFAGLADEADKLATPRKINNVNFDGTANITVYDSTKVAKTGDTMTGKLILDTPVVGNASLNLPHGVAPTSPVNGDVWTTTAGQFNRIGGITRQVAYITSNITGTAANVTGIIAVAHGGTGADDVTEARANLLAAKSGVNSDITKLTGLTTPLSHQQGGTGLTSPGPIGNVLISDGSNWTSGKVHYPVSGMVMYFAGRNAPPGWLVCNGAKLLRSAYPDLYQAIGLTYSTEEGVLQSIEAADPKYGMTVGNGTIKLASGSGVGETGGFSTVSVGGGPYVRFGTVSRYLSFGDLQTTYYTVNDDYVTLHFAAQSAAPYTNSEKISLTGFAQTELNGTWTVQSCTTTAVVIRISAIDIPASSQAGMQGQLHKFMIFTTRYASSGGIATVYYRALLSPPYQVGGRITVNGIHSSGYNGTWDVLECTNTYVKFKITNQDLIDSSLADNQGTIYKPRFATFTANTKYADQLNFVTIRGNDNNGGEQPNNATDSLILYYRNASDVLVKIGNIYPSTGDPDATLEETTSAYGYDWKTRRVTIPSAARKDNQVFEVHQAPIGAEFKTGQDRNADLADTFGIKTIQVIDVRVESDGTTFDLPDLRGEFIRGWDNGRGIDLGRGFGTWQEDKVGNHRHNLRGNRDTQFYVINDGNQTPQDAGAFRAQGPDARRDGQWYPYTGYVDGNAGAWESRPRNIAMLPCIKI